MAHRTGNEERDILRRKKKNNVAYPNHFKFLLTLALYSQMARGNGFYELTK